ncbi:Acyl-CoA dehydrogenase family member 9, mitochondrial [Papilio machaon]|uniref:Acyl-CoA dehydrogenase family member 9, mitochondrial n=1 Tax=Papilio machaon TaxID=76193 RepID=A0A0N1IPU0_PAPMA|nr:Acyl-CoA dehydrogenase family member 9, mitochondrial [Papilio machaon]
MNIARTICTIRYQSINKRFSRKITIGNRYESSSTQPQVKDEKYNFEDLKVLERVERRKAKIPPFMKNVFVSIFDRDLLAFPEILNKDESEALDQRVAALDRVFSDPDKTIEDRKNALKGTKMYAAPVALTDNGLAVNHTESLRYLEAISTDLKLSQQISDHWVGLNALKIGLAEDMYQKVINDLISGENTIALCIRERVAERISQADFRTTAEVDERGVWRISGEKICLQSSEYYLVLSIVDTTRLKMFLVHPGAYGVSHNGTYVTFMKTPALPLDMATEENLAKTLGVSRLYTASLCRSSLLQAMKIITEYITPRTFSGKPMSEVSTIRSVIGEALLNIYASESAEYFTAGLLDGYMDPDAELEIAMCRSGDTNFNLLGCSGIMSERDDPKLNLYLAEHLHPSLRVPSEQLEYCVLRMKFSCETLLSRHGMDVTNAFTELSRMAEAGSEILAMTAVLARASRSYCIGLRNAEVEMKLAACFVESSKERVKKLILEVNDGEYLNLDKFKTTFGRKVLETKSVLVEKPTARVFW